MKRVPYKAPRDRRELVTAITVGVLIFVVTATLVWFLRPNRESSTTSTPAATVPTTPTTTAATDTTVPGDTTPTDTTVPQEPTPQDTTAPDGG